MSVWGKKDDRLGLRINSKLKKEVQRYCATHGVEMSDLTTRFFARIVERERQRKKQEGA